MPPQRFELCASSSNILKHKKIIDGSLGHISDIKTEQSFQCKWAIERILCFLSELIVAAGILFSPLNEPLAPRTGVHAGNAALHQVR